MAANIAAATMSQRQRTDRVLSLIAALRGWVRRFTERRAKVKEHAQDLKARLERLREIRRLKAKLDEQERQLLEDIDAGISKMVDDAVDVHERVPAAIIDLVQRMEDAA